MIPGAAYLMKLRPAERRAAVGGALEAVREKAAELALLEKAKTPDPRTDLQYKTWRTLKLFAVPVVRHSDRPASIEVSRDGDAAGKHAFIPRRSAPIVLPESRAPLQLVLVGKPIARWIAEKQGVSLSAVPADLIGDWSDEDRKHWARLRALAGHININIQRGGSARRPRQMLLSRGEAA